MDVQSHLKDLFPSSSLKHALLLWLLKRLSSQILFACVLLFVVEHTVK